MARTHGTISCYNRGQCRCEDCKRAARLHRYRYREEPTEDGVGADGRVLPLHFCIFCGRGVYWVGLHERACR